MFHKFHRRFKFGRGRHGGPGGRGPFGGGPGPFGGGRGPFGGERQRHRRGDIRLVLLQLIAEQPRHGYELIKLVEERNSGFYRPSPGVIYPTLQLLEDEGHLTSQTVEGKRVYTITESGRALVASQRESEGERRGKRHEQLPELRHKAAALMESVMQAARYGTPSQVEAVQALLTKAAQDVHAIMARNDEPPRHV